MNQKELREIRRRFSLDKDSISRVYGCYVNAAKEIVARIDMSVGLMEQEEAEMYLKLLKTPVSGTLGRNLLDIAFSTAQVENSDEHRLLMALKSSHLRDESLRELLYERIDKRVDEMVTEGLVEEVQKLKNMGYNRSFVSMQGLGYKEILSYLEGEISLEEAVYILKRDTRHFAKRQITWFKREKEVIWVNKPEFNYDNEKILDFMQEHINYRKKEH